MSLAIATTAIAWLILSKIIPVMGISFCGRCLVRNPATRYLANALVISWKHGSLKTLAKALGAKGVDDYPDDRYDLIWTLEYDYKEISSITSEGCQGLDEPGSPLLLQ